jgi:hypothetical protein
VELKVAPRAVQTKPVDVVASAREAIDLNWGADSVVADEACDGIHDSVCEKKKQKSVVSEARRICFSP